MDHPNIESAQSALQSFLNRGISAEMPYGQNFNSISSPVMTAAWSAPENPRHGPMPPVSRITYATIGVFDNDGKPDTYTDPFTGKTRKRQKANRFKVTIDAWTTPAHQIIKHRGGEFSRQIWVKEAPEFIKKIVQVNLASKAFTDAQATRMCEIVAHDQDAFYGVISDRDNGFTYFPEQVIKMRFDEEDLPQVTFYLGDEVLVADRMTDEFLTSGQRASGVIAQEYLDRCGYGTYWAKHKAASTRTLKYQPKPHS